MEMHECMYALYRSVCAVEKRKRRFAADTSVKRSVCLSVCRVVSSGQTKEVSVPKSKLLVLSMADCTAVRACVLVHIQSFFAVSSSQFICMK